MARRNIKGQYTSEKLLEIKLNKRLNEIAQEYDFRLKALVRDKLAEELRHQIYASRVSTGDGSYEHTRLLPTSVYAVIEGDIIKTKLIDNYYKGVDSEGNETNISVEDVYNYLKFGTPEKAESDVYPYLDENGKVSFAHYHQTPVHDFETKTKKEINKFLTEIENNPELALKPYMSKYTRKSKQKL